MYVCVYVCVCVCAHMYVCVRVFLCMRLRVYYIYVPAWRCAVYKSYTCMALHSATSASRLTSGAWHMARICRSPLPLAPPTVYVYIHICVHVYVYMLYEDSHRASDT